MHSGAKGPFRPSKRGQKHPIGGEGVAHFGAGENADASHHSQFFSKSPSRAVFLLTIFA